MNLSLKYYQVHIRLSFSTAGILPVWICQSDHLWNKLSPYDPRKVCMVEGEWTTYHTQTNSNKHGSWKYSVKQIYFDFQKVPKKLQNSVSFYTSRFRRIQTYTFYKELTSFPRILTFHLIFRSNVLSKLL